MKQSKTLTCLFDFQKSFKNVIFRAAIIHRYFIVNRPTTPLTSTLDTIPFTKLSITRTITLFNITKICQ